MKRKRSLSGMFFRVKNEETGKFDNVAFEDLSEEQQEKVMDGRSNEWLKSLAKELANTINKIGEQFNFERNNSKRIRRFRIVRDDYLGYEAQQWRLWFPFWTQIGFTNTHSTVERAEEYIKKRGVVRYVDV